MLKGFVEKYLFKYGISSFIVGITILMVASAFFFVYKQSSKDVVKKVVNTDDVIVIKEEISEPEINYLYVDIKGAITKPGVYQLEDGARIIDVVKKANGLTEKADTSVLNLSKKISDEMVVIIYTKDEMNSYRAELKTREEIIKQIEKECHCPDPNINGACVDSNKTEVNEGSFSIKVSLNTANKEELMTLPGIGEAKAQDIINYRVDNGSFKSIDEIKNVGGIGESIFGKVKDFITV